MKCHATHRTTKDKEAVAIAMLKALAHAVAEAALASPRKSTSDIFPDMHQTCLSTFQDGIKLISHRSVACSII